MSKKKKRRPRRFVQMNDNVRVKKSTHDSLYNAVAEIYGDKCFLCGDEHAWLDRHHVRFRRNGGKFTVENVVLLCWQCHHVKLHENKESERYYTELILKKKAELDNNH